MQPDDPTTTAALPKVLCDHRWSLVTEYAVNLERLLPVSATKVINRVTFHDAVKTLHEVVKHRQEVEHDAE